MPLYDNPPHRVDVYALATGVDAGGGNQNNYTLIQSAVPCVVNSTGSHEVERFGQTQIVDTVTVSFKASVLNTPLVRGMKLVAGNVSYHVMGINYNQAYGNIPELMAASCEVIQ